MRSLHVRLCISFDDLMQELGASDLDLKRISPKRTCAPLEFDLRQMKQA